MNREIKFRGKSKLNNKWHFGSFVKGEAEDLDHIIAQDSDLSGDGIDFHSVRVISKTVGQYTGLKDANGVEVYEGDIIECYGEEHEVVLKAEVQFLNGCFCVQVDYDLHLISLDAFETSYVVIGNIHEHPELLTK